MKVKKFLSLVLSLYFVFYCYTGYGIVHADEFPYEESAVTTCKGRSVYAKIYLEDYDPDRKSDMDDLMSEEYSDAILLRSATSSYNCHSYAWHSQSTSNTYWVPYPGAFLEDGTYAQSAWTVGDKIVYYRNGEPIHSGIITAKTSNTLSGITVTSKWGAFGLYRHPGNHCPYSEADGSYTVVVFRLCTHSGNYLTYTFSAAGHRVTCDACGVLGIEQHDLNIYNICTVCGGKGPNIDINDHFEEEAA